MNTDSDRRTLEKTRSIIDEILQEFRAALHAGRSLLEPLDAVLQATNGRATGLWHVRGAFVELLGFRGVSAMADDVKQEFAAATRRVSLEMTKLGIVKAVVTEAPAVARLAERESMSDSASWLERFEAMNSLAVPIFGPEDVVGVLAVSSANVLGDNGPADQILLGVARGLGELVS